jgi:BlaI family transcriptional regulator, penicillinase repressor
MSDKRFEILEKPCCILECKCPKAARVLTNRWCDETPFEPFVAGVWGRQAGFLRQLDRRTPSRDCLASRTLDEALDSIKHSAYCHRHRAYKCWKGFVVVKKPVGVTDAELAVLKVLWARKALTAKAITEAIYPDGAESEFAAVHSFLQRLERKGLVARDRGSFVHMFSATASQADVLGQELKTLAARLGAGSIAPLIMQLIEEKRLSKKEAAEIRTLLEKYSK